MTQIVFFILSLGTIIGALGTILCKNAYYSAMWMISAFVSLAGLFVMLNAPFVAMLQIIVYAGAIAILILFVMMLMDRRVLNNKERFNPQYFWGIILGVGLFSDLAVLAFKFRINITNAGKSLTLHGSNTKMVGDVLFKHYLFPFEIIAIILLIALIGAIVLTKKDEEEAR